MGPVNVFRGSMNVQNVCIFTHDFANIFTELASDSQRVYDPFPLVKRHTEIIIIQRHLDQI